MKKKNIITILIISVIAFCLSFSSVFIYDNIKNRKKSFDEKEEFIQLALQDSNKINYLCINKSFDMVMKTDKFESEEFDLYLYWNKSLMDDAKNLILSSDELDKITYLCDTECKNLNFMIYKINNQYIISETNIGMSQGIFVYLYKDNSLIQLSKGVLNGSFIIGINLL